MVPYSKRSESDAEDVVMAHGIASVIAAVLCGALFLIVGGISASYNEAYELEFAQETATYQFWLAAQNKDNNLEEVAGPEAVALVKALQDEDLPALVRNSDNSNIDFAIVGDAYGPLCETFTFKVTETNFGDCADSGLVTKNFANTFSSVEQGRTPLIAPDPLNHSHAKQYFWWALLIWNIAQFIAILWLDNEKSLKNYKGTWKMSWLILVCPWWYGWDLPRQYWSYRKGKAEFRANPFYEDICDIDRKMKELEESFGLDQEFFRQYNVWSTMSMKDPQGAYDMNRLIEKGMRSTAEAVVIYNNYRAQRERMLRGIPVEEVAGPVVDPKINRELDLTPYKNDMINKEQEYAQIIAASKKALLPGNPSEPEMAQDAY